MFIGQDNDNKKDGPRSESQAGRTGGNVLQPTDIGDPDYFHKVVDCQWACPAHTPVPEYIRLIAAGRYADAYMVNWQSNVFPGILGRTCDRPCEPACRRGRVEEEPVAICRLKRVAADYKGDIRDRLPLPAAQRNGKRIALVGAGPASLTVARDLAPLGYELRAVRRRGRGRRHDPQPDPEIPPARGGHRRGGRLHHSISASRPRLGQRIDSLKGAAGRGLRRDLRRLRRAARPRPGLPGPQGGGGQHPYRHRLAVLGLVRPHRPAIGKRVIVLGGGNTAMDCCRSARRLGGEDVKVIVRIGFEEMKASPWEKEDAMHEDIPILNYLVPKEFTHEDGRLTGVLFEKVSAECDEKGRRSWCRPASRTCIIECDDVLVAVGQENAFPWIERDIGIEFDRWGMPVVDEDHDAVDHPERVLRRRRGVRAEEHHLGGGARPSGGDLDRQAVQRGGRARPPAPRCDARPARRWASTSGATTTTSRIDLRYRVPHADKAMALRDIKAEVELGFDDELAFKEAQRCLNCDVQTVFTRPLCIECDACVDICPVDCITFTENGEEAELRERLNAPAQNLTQDLYVSGRTEDRPRDGEGRGCLPALRPVRRAVPDRRVGYAALLLDMAQAGARMSRAARARQRLRRQVRQRQRFGLGQRQPAVRRSRSCAWACRSTPRNIFPVQHPGPADLVRGAGFGGGPSRRARRRRT